MNTSCYHMHLKCIQNVFDKVNSSPTQADFHRLHVLISIHRSGGYTTPANTAANSKPMSPPKGPSFLATGPIYQTCAMEMTAPAIPQQAEKLLIVCEDVSMTQDIMLIVHTWPRFRLATYYKRLKRPETWRTKNENRSLQTR